ncbi:type II toxin-antitoxin system RelE/ParE family toxin [Streptomyces sp. NBC_01537]|uniref:type II toxin-antitoxin system RelE/ParE family toxin n=1 Tax=Streptomyces sp. NBC_01537 TaxID=2903896 RepID=UPI00386EF53B
MTLLQPVEDWFLRLCRDDPECADQIVDALDHLALEAPSLGRPMVDRIHRSVVHNLKELRPGSTGRSEVRMLFVFDPDREAVILVAGDKPGQWSNWYDENIPIAEHRYGEYLEAKKHGGVE